MSVEILSELVAIPSVSGNERKLAEHIANYCDVPGFTVDMIDNNVAVRIPGEDSSKAVLFDGHMDTVPGSLDDEWTVDPFRLLPDPYNPGRMTGLGASDMKAGLALMLDLAGDLREQRPPNDVYLFFTENEERTPQGSERLTEVMAPELLDRYGTALGGLVLEPTDAIFVGTGSRGDTWWEVTAQGPGGHSALEFVGLTAIEKVARLIAALPAIRGEWEQHYTNHYLRSPSIKATMTAAGTAANMVPTEAGATLNLRVTSELAAVLDHERRRIESGFDVCIAQSWEPGPMLCDPQSRIFKTMESILPHAPFKAYPGATDQYYFLTHDIPMLVYGPGDFAEMHQPNEGVNIARMRTCKRVMEQLTRRF